MARTSPGCDVGRHPLRLHALEVVGDPVDQLVPARAELGTVHLDLLRALRMIRHTMNASASRDGDEHDRLAPPAPRLAAAVRLGAAR